MTTINKLNIEPRKAWFNYSLLTKSLLVIAFLITAMQTKVAAQQYSKPSWYFGVVGAANVNFFDGSTRQLNAQFSSPVTFHKGRGVGVYAGGLIQYRPAQSVLGFMLQGGYDSRRGKFEQQTTACNCPADLSTNLSYVTLEPSLLLAPFKNGFYIYAGPRMAYTTEKSFTYKQGINPAIPNQVAPADVEGEINNTQTTRISGQVGMGYDFMMGSSDSKTKFVVSPFVSYHPYFGQNPRTSETWNLTTIRAGIALKVGAGRKIVPVATPVPPVVVVADRDGDGVLDIVDRCPDIAGPASLQGCPDKDGDGIADRDDKCPDVFGLARYQGCPIPDMDNDGVNDELDKCPTIAGLARYQGCPVPDTDGDGVNDEDDKCILEKGPASNFGCPVISPEIIRRVKIAAENIFFETAKSTLLPKSFPKLNDVVSILKDNASFKLQIDGHTDFVGNDAYNQTLSEQRAASVRAYLVGQGIAESRISSAGYGESRPVADNNTTAGKAKNRRVEMTLRNY